MPAVTVDDVSDSRSDRCAVTRRTGTTGVSGDHGAHGLEGEGFPVRRAFAGVPHELLDPFIHMDQMGEVEYGAG